MIFEKIPYNFELCESDGLVYFDIMEDWLPPEGKVEWRDSSIFFNPELLSTIESLVEIHDIKMDIRDKKLGLWRMGFNLSVIGTIENITMLKLIL